MRDILGREIKRGDIVAAIGSTLSGFKLVLLNVIETSPFAIQVEHKEEGRQAYVSVRTDPTALVIVHEADEPYPVNAPQP